MTRTRTTAPVALALIIALTAHPVHAQSEEASASESPVVTVTTATLTEADAMIDAGHKRARPIVMTTVAMAAGMLPSALAIGTGGEFRAPMAFAVIGGLLVSTLLSLLFVPSLFSVINSIKDRSRRMLVNGLGANKPTASTTVSTTVVVAGDA